MNARLFLCVLGLIVIIPALAPAQVQEEWVRRYVSSNRVERPWAIQTDSAGNAYVAADSWTPTNYYDFLTLKYGPDGTLLWQARYNSTSGNSGDFAHALALDDSANVYVFGVSDHGGSARYLTVVKYGPDGNQIWVARHIEGLFAEPVALLVRSNAVYIAGYSYASESGWDYLTVKFDSNGNELWAARYTGNGVSQETVSGIALDPAGNVIVTGATLSNAPSAIATVKYDPNGVAVWTNISVAAPGGYYGSAKGVAVDALGGIYIGGQLTRNAGGGAYGLRKLDSAGHELWSAVYGGTEGNENYLWTMTLDSVGNVLLTGTSTSTFGSDCVTAKFDSTGNRLWAARYAANDRFSEDYASAIKVDGEGSTYIAGYSAKNFATIKYDPSGNQLWAIRYGSEGGYESPADLALDPAGNVYVTGLSGNPSTGEDIVTVKYGQVSVPGLPQITSPAHDVEILAGTNVMFEVTAMGNAPLYYQWRKNGAPLFRETNRTLVILKALDGHEGDYSAIVSNAAGVTISPEARLTVLDPPEIPTAWTNLLVNAGGHAYVTASANGDPPLFYQWQFNGSDLAGETNSSLLLFDMSTNQTGNYSLVVTNAYGRAEKILAAITVRAPDTLDRWSWRHPKPQGNDCHAVAYGNGRFVTVGEGGTILVSDDGIAWRNRTVDWFDLGAIAFGNGTFVAVGPFGGLLTSPDGEHWTKHVVPGTFGYAGDLYDVAFGNGVFVAVGARLVISSNDGAQWQAWPDAPSASILTVGFGNGKFVAYAYNPSGIAITSSDGVNWATQAVQPTSLGIQDVTFGNGLFVAMGDGAALFSSPDGITWNNRFGGFFLDLAFANGTFIAVGNGIARSTDGFSWTQVLRPQTNFLEGVAYGDGRFVVVGDQGIVLTSADGLSWTERGGGSPNNFRGIARAARGFAAIGNEGAVWTSGDGFGWANRGAITTNNLRAIVWGKDKLVAVGEGGSILSSAEGIAWTRQSPTTIDLYGLHYGNGQFVAVGESGLILVSDDGVNWATATSGSTRRLQGITFGKGFYVATGRTGTILISSNALTWQARPSPTSEYLESVVASSNLFVAVGQNGAIVVSPDGLTWTKRETGFFWDIESVAYADGIFMAVGDNGKMMTSNDGGDWLSRFTGCGNTLRHVMYADGAFWAAGNNETILKSGQIRPHLAVPRRDGSAVTVSIEAELGRAHRLQGSPNLADWFDLFSFTPNEETTVYRDVETNESRRFYRVISP